MNDSTTNRKLTPVQVITVYTDKQKSKYYLEQREVKNIGGKSILMAAVPMSDEILKNVAKTYMKSNSVDMNFGDFVSEHLLYGTNNIGKTVVMWYRPEMKRNLKFSASIGIKAEKTVMVPATLYVVINSKLYLFALLDSKRPTLNTKIYNAPFFNIYYDGNVCLGTAHIGKMKAKTFELEAERFERGFFMAEQNGGDHTGVCKSSLKSVWNELIKKGGNFPSKQQLVQHKKYKTVADVVNQLISKNQ